MAFEKYSAIYKNNNLTINDEEIQGNVKDIVDCFKYEMASQLMGINPSIEDIITNLGLTKDILEQLNDLPHNDIIKVKYNPMGAYYIEENGEIPLF